MITVDDLLRAYALAYDTWLDPDVTRQDPTPEYAKLIRHAVNCENEKLRELACDMYECIRNANGQDWFYFERDKPGCGLSCTVNGEACGLSMLAERARELGIEVQK